MMNADNDTRNKHSLINIHVTVHNDTQNLISPQSLPKKLVIFSYNNYIFSALVKSFYVKEHQK